ncbi:DNA recombination protein RmuC [Apibacter sp.]|uniref:DNA recombination protein RmuC n=1 Tax=Apibacter sp. TaxID=2023709 RepID=UPI0025E45BA9|nr:DNA recombination protein RmuC [Apibacter sp.]MCT6870096.1 DNA recombination protein RmuC [Apibacter sp.]
MIELFLVLIGGIIFLLLGIYIGKKINYISDQSEKILLNEKIKEINNKLIISEKALENELFVKENILKEREQLLLELTRKDADFENLVHKNQEQKQEIIEIQNNLRKEFEIIASQILEQKTEKFTEQNKHNIKNILDPLQEKIAIFEKRVEDSQKENIGIYVSLKEQLQYLQNQNIRISQEAENLTKALKGDTKIQGNWGELVLERVLEKSGLEKDREYFIQESLYSEEGKRYIPDVVIHLPDNKKMIIDSKVSLIAYERYINDDNEEDKNNYLKDHINSIKKHIQQLSSKNYHNLYADNTLDFILLFIPIETAFSVALNQDSSLYNKAFEENIVIVTPSTLLATLKTIDSMWNNQKQQKNAYEIAKTAGNLYDKFEGFLQDLLRIGKKMDEAKNEYGQAMNKLVEGRGNIVSHIEKLKKMGAKANKTLPEEIVNKAQIIEGD